MNICVHHTTNHQQDIELYQLCMAICSKEEAAQKQLRLNDLMMMSLTFLSQNSFLRAEVKKALAACIPHSPFGVSMYHLFDPFHKPDLIVLFQRQEQGNGISLNIEPGYHLHQSHQFEGFSKSLTSAKV